MRDGLLYSAGGDWRVDVGRSPTAMRRPIPDEELLSYHSRALSGERVPVFEDEPQSGWYRRRMVKNGPWVPVMIWLEQEVDDAGDLCDEPRWTCLVDDEQADALDHWTRCAGKPILKATYDHMIADRRWMRQHDPSNPALAIMTATPLHEAAGRL